MWSLEPPLGDRRAKTQYWLVNGGRCGGTDPVSPDGQRVGRVHVPLPVVARLPVSEDLHLEVADHGVHHLPGGSQSGAIRRDKGSADSGVPPILTRTIDSDYIAPQCFWKNN